MTALVKIAKSESTEVAEALDKTRNFADALDQVFKKAAVTELLLMAALSHYDQSNAVPVDKLSDCTRAITHHLLEAKDQEAFIKSVADKIRAMSDEEYAGFKAKFQGRCAGRRNSEADQAKMMI